MSIGPAPIQSMPARMPAGSWILSHLVSAAQTPKVAATAMMIATHHRTGSTNHIRTSSSASVQGMNPIGSKTTP